MVAWYNYSWGNGDLEPMIQQWKTWWSHWGWPLLNTMNFILSHNASPWGMEHRQAFSIWDSLTVHVTPEGSGPDHFPTGLIIKQLLISIDCWAGEGPGERGAVGKLISKRVGNIFPWSEHKKRNLKYKTEMLLKILDYESMMPLIVTLFSLLLRIILFTTVVSWHVSP